MCGPSFLCMFWDGLACLPFYQQPLEGLMGVSLFSPWTQVRLSIYQFGQFAISYMGPVVIKLHMFYLLYIYIFLSLCGCVWLSSLGDVRHRWMDHFDSWGLLGCCDFDLCALFFMLQCTYDICLDDGSQLGI